MGLHHLQSTARAGGFDLAIEGEHLAGMELAFEPGAVEPEALHGGDALTDGHFKEGHAAGAEEGGAADFGDDAGGFAGLEIGEGAGVEAVFVAEGEMKEEVFDGEDALVAEEFGDGGADALNVLDWRFEGEHWRTG